VDSKSVPFDQLPFSKLFQDYTTSKNSALTFFESNPFDSDSYRKRITQIGQRADRKFLVQFLKEFNSDFTNSGKAISQIDKFSDPDTVAIVTGQQVSLYGGPLYTIYKTVTAILYAEKLSKELNCNVIPVFWLADEDHDFDEIKSISVPDDESNRTLHYEGDSDGIRAASVRFDESVERLNKELFEVLHDTDFTEQIKKPIENYYKEGESFGRAFGNLLLKLFADHGLILAGSDHPKAKDLVKGLFTKSIKEHADIQKTLDDTTYDLIEEGYHGQVQVQSSNLFFIEPDGKRKKLEYKDQKWTAGNTEFDAEELISRINQNPEQFSPNVFLRPLVQDSILPVLATVGGPGETAYYAQMKNFYRYFGMQMPVILPRFSITLVESSIGRIMDKLPFSITEYNQRIEDLEKQFVIKSETKDLEKLFGEWKNYVDELTIRMKNEVEEVDPSLKASAGKASAVYFSELDKLKGKLYRSIKENEKIQINRISKIKNHLFPDQELQERHTAFIYFMNKYGINIWDDLLSNLENEQSDSHKIIEI